MVFVGHVQPGRQTDPLGITHQKCLSYHWNYDVVFWPTTSSYAVLYYVVGSSTTLPLVVIFGADHQNQPSITNDFVLVVVVFCVVWLMN